MTKEHADVVVVGAGLVGSILAIFLRQRGYNVRMFEKRADMRVGQAEGGRSINLVVTSRGLQALEQVGLKKEVLAITKPVYGRMMHDLDGELTYQSYSKDDSECNYSVSRAQLNKEMMTHAERAGVEIEFSCECTDIDHETGTIWFGERKVTADAIFATDGAGSAVRRELVKQGHLEDSVDFLPHGYKELLIPAGENNAFLIEEKALHIWPRGEHMLMALPNLDGSFTVTLYLANEGEVSFAALQTKEDVMAYFQKYYADSLALLPTLGEEFFENPTGLLGTVRCAPWYVGEKVVLLGDAAHGVVPFFGQGMNAGFEDCSVLDKCLDVCSDQLDEAIAMYSDIQKANGDAIADMAIENFIEMSEKVGDEAFLLQKQVEAKVGRTFPDLYLSRYSMVTHSLIPYHVCQKAGLIQQEILDALTQDIQSADEVDLSKAELLIREKLSPFYAQYQVEG